MEAWQFIKNYLGPKYDGLGAPYRIDPVGLRNQAMDSAKQVTGFNTPQVLDMSNALQNNAMNAIGGIQAGFNNPYQTGAKWYADNYGMGQVPVMNWMADRMGDFSGVLTERAWSDYNAGPNALEKQIFSAGQNAMESLATQVNAPQNMRELQASLGQEATTGAALGSASLAALVDGPSAARAQAAQAQTVSGPSAASAQRVAEISRGATDVGAGALGQTLLSDATRRLASGGRLTPQAERDVAQSTRASFAARGLATSAPAAMAEALNRDRYSRARSLEDRQYAQEVQAEDIGRQQNNAQRQLAALQGNQQIGAQMSLADQAALNEMRRLGYTGSIDQQQFNAGNQQTVNLANQAAANQMALARYQGSIDQWQFNAGNQQAMNLANLAAQNQTNQFNAGNQQAMNLANMSALNQIGLANQARDQALAGMSMDAQVANQAANLNQMQNNRAFMLNAANAFTSNQLGRMGQAGNILSLGANLLGQAGSLRGAAGNLGLSGARTMADLDPYARSLDAGLRLGGMTQGLANESVLTNFGNMLDLGANADSFNVNMLQDRENAWLNNATAAFTGQQAANSAREAANITSAANVAAARAARPKWYETAIGGITKLFSDKRMKTDIKPLGKAGSVLGLTAYEFRYKGDKKKHKGFMAQDVQKVLPEAVEEKNYKGKKRLTIKPAVIGAALAEELMTAKAA